MSASITMVLLINGAFSTRWSTARDSITNALASRHDPTLTLAPSPVLLHRTNSTMLLDTTEIWQSPHLGRYQVHRLAIKPPSAPPAKPPQQRLIIMRTMDPFLDDTTFGGPHAAIHKHSAAIAFSIIRSYSLFGTSAPGPGATPLHSASRDIPLHKGSTIMLASKKVQQQYTSSNRTDKLTHNLLELGSHKPRAHADKSSSRGPSFLEKVMRWEKVKELDNAKKENVKHKNKEGLSYSTDSTIASTPDHSVEKFLDEDQVSSHGDSIDSDEHPLIPTPHPEPFGTLDPNHVERLRRPQKPSYRASSFPDRIFRRFPGVSSRPDSSRSLPAITPPNPCSSPCIITAARHQNEGLVRDLHNAFHDLGLLHTQPHKSGLKSSSKKTGHDMFHFLPESSPYMLLPFWAAEMVPNMNPSPDMQATALPMIPEDRQYLLVWYVPFKNEPDQHQQPNPKNKAKQSRLTSDATSHSNHTNIYLSGFCANARLLGYNDLRGSGFRLPSHGLATTAPACEAVDYDVEPAREVMQISDAVICVCCSRENGFQFQLEGLTKLGLCLQEVAPSPSPLPPAGLGSHEQREVEPRLTPIGRAAVEMVWLGCLAITSFDPA